MSLFKKKKIYAVVWRYSILCTPDTDIVKAKDMYSAWKKVERKHSLHIELVEIKEITEILK
jgi:hypothetical protein